MFEMTTFASIVGIVTTVCFQCTHQIDVELPKQNGTKVLDVTLPVMVFWSTNNMYTINTLRIHTGTNLKNTATWLVDCLAFLFVADMNIPRQTETRSRETTHSLTERLQWVFWMHATIGSLANHHAFGKPVRHHWYASTPKQPGQEANPRPSDHESHPMCVVLE